jgi:hypothetical protein
MTEVASFQVDPGAYRPCNALLYSGCRGSLFKESKYANGTPPTKRLGSMDGAE